MPRFRQLSEYAQFTLEGRVITIIERYGFEAVLDVLAAYAGQKYEQEDGALGGQRWLHVLDGLNRVVDEL